MEVQVRPEWQLVGSMSNADLYQIAPDVIAVVPHHEASDTEATARESLALQARHWRSAGRRGAVVVFMDAILSQDSGARAVYMNESDPALVTCFALVGETFFGQAVGAVFTGLSRPQVPTNMFRTLEEAMPWIAEMNRTRGGAL